MTAGSDVMQPRYRFGFILSTTIGNMTRYLNLRKYAEQDPDIECVWAPANHYTPPDFPSRLRFLPEPLFMRARMLQQAHPVLSRLGDLDAVMIHLFEADILCSLRGYLRAKPLLVSSTDEAPVTNQRAHPLYPNDLMKPVWRQKLRLSIDMWRVRRTDCFIPFSHWVADALERDCGAPADRVHPLHVGLDLDLWQAPSRATRPSGSKFRILFVGTDFERKGGPLLLDVFRHRFQDVAELHLVTRQAPSALPPNVHVHADFHPNDPRFPALYASVDVLAVPTTADVGPLWVFMEAMASGLPIIGTDTGSNTELVVHGETGLIVEIGNADALASALETLRADPKLRESMGSRGRELIEANYNARKNVPAILNVMKRVVDEARAGDRSRSSLS